MKIQQPTSPVNQNLMPRKPEGRDNVEQPPTDSMAKDKLENPGFGVNQQLYIGAKSLMAALNRELKLDGSFSFSSSSSYNVSVNTEQSSILDKIDVEPISFDFEEVAKNVLDFVSGVIQGAKDSGASDDKLNEMFEQARAGVDMGFEQAREELGDMNMLSDDVKQGMDKSYDLIQGGIDALHQKLLNPQPSVSIISEELAMSEHEEGSISITTLDGDEININFSNSMSLGYSQSADGGSFRSEMNLSSSHSFSFEVHGSLDEEELKSVASLVKDIGQLADEFFNGDIEQAWQQANTLDFDQSQIAQYALDFQEVKQVSLMQNYVSDTSASPIATLSPYMKDLNQVMAQGQELFAGDSLKQMMQEIAQQQVDLVDDLVMKSSSDFTDFNQQLLNAQ